MSIGDFIRFMRESAGMSQERFAALTNRTQAFISQVERGVIYPTDEFIAELVAVTDNQFLRAYLFYVQWEKLASMLTKRPGGTDDWRAA